MMCLLLACTYLAHLELERLLIIGAVAVAVAAI